MGMIVRGLRQWGLAAFFLCLSVPSLLLLGSSDVVLAQSAQPRIDVEGNRRVEADTIRSYIRVGPNDRVDAAKLDLALKALYETGLFQDVRITPLNGRILVTVVENPVINRVAFEGNHKAKDEQLSSEIQSKPRGTFSRAQVQSDVQRIIEIYQRGGRYDVRVDPKIVELPNGRVDLIFEINEGAKTGVASLNFVGNKFYSDYRLKDVIKTQVSDWFSFLKSGDVYDPDRLEADRDLLRRFYLKNGFADVRIVSATGEYDAGKKGFVIVFTIDEGEQYHFGVVNIESGVPTVPGESLRPRLRVDSGRVFNADAIEKTVEDMAIEMARRGYPFSAVRPRADRNFQAKTVNLTFLVEEGPHTYVERINIKGNTRTRDYVIRREFDIVEGDAYNRALVDRAERRIKNLGFFKTVKITTEPGSAPDRIIINCDVEEQSTGELSFAGGYSTSEGIIGEVSVAERNLLGRGQQGKVSLQYGQYAKGLNLSFVEPYFLDYRLAFGVDAFGKQTLPTTYLSYGSTVIGGDLKFGVPLSENISTQLRVTGYEQKINLPTTLNDCNNINPDFLTSFPTPDMSPVPNNNPAGIPGHPTPAIQQAYNNFLANSGGAAPLLPNCYAEGQASLAVRKELAAGAVFVSSLGYTVSYNTLDNNRSPANGLLVELRQDIAGAPGAVNFVKTTLEGRLYDEIFPDIVALLHLQGGYATGWGGDELRMLDHFQAGPNMVRGFAPAGFGPRDLTEAQFGYAEKDALGGSIYWGSSVELQTPLPYLPKDFGIKIAAFADAGWLGNYVGPTSWMNQSMLIASDDLIRSSVGIGIIWDSPFGPLRFDFAYALTKEPYDRTQFFRFGGGTRF